MGKRTGNPRGRPKGSPNKVTKDLKAAIIGALDASGGQRYLERIAKEDPRTFCALLGRVIPTTLNGDPANPVKTVLEVRWGTASNT